MNIFTMHQVWRRIHFEKFREFEAGISSREISNRTLRNEKTPTVGIFIVNNWSTEQIVSYYRPRRQTSLQSNYCRIRSFGLLSFRPHLILPLTQGDGKGWNFNSCPVGSGIELRSISWFFHDLKMGEAAFDEDMMKCEKCSFA